MSSNAPIILHIVYIHGFQGDHTTFQAFPTDLHHALQPTLPPHVELRSILYPTYKSKRPIAIATERFLQWLETLPAGPVILCGHSMGGLLAAEAATSPINAASKRVVALLAYDVPFLGMHPHVVISGIASLLPNHKKGELGQGGINGGTSGLKTERQMNDARHVDIPSEAQISSPYPNTSYTSSPTGHMGSATSSGQSLTPPPLPPRPSSSSQAQTQTQSRDQQLSSLPYKPAFISRAVDFLQSHADDRVVHFISKHRSEPITAAKRWVVESFEFGVCMFDPKGLRDRYAALERWQGDWVAFWTETVPRDSDGREMPAKPDEGDDDDQEASRKEQEATASLGRLLNGDSATDSVTSSPSVCGSLTTISSLEGAVDASVSGAATKNESIAIEKQIKVDQKKRNKESKSQAKADRNRREAEIKAMRKRNTQSPHHFIVCPFREPSGLKHRWEKVKIRGAKDEVEAHCGLFLKDINVDYDAFLRRVAEVTQGWVVKLST